MSFPQDSPQSSESKAGSGSINRASKIAFFAWLAYLPGLSLFLASGSASGGAAYAAPAGLVTIAIGGLALGFIAAVALGVGTKTLGVSLIGLLLGIPLSALVYVTLEEVTRSSQQQVREEEKRKVRVLATLLAIGDRDRLFKVLTAPEARSSAVLACELERLESERYEGLKPPLAVEAAEMLKFAEVAIEANLSSDEKQALMYVTLTSLSRRDSQSMQLLNNWFVLWRRAAPGGMTAHAIDTRWHFSEYQYGCSWGDPVAIATAIFSGWKDRGITAWLDAGFTLTPEQFHVVLKVVETAEVLERAVATAVDVHTVGLDDPRVARELLPLVARADAWSRQLDGGEWSEETVKLAAALVRLATADARVDACNVFVKNELSRKSVLANPSDPYFPHYGFKPDTPSRSRGAAALHAVLCQGSVTT
jgi:hypothetical protein